MKLFLSFVISFFFIFSLNLDLSRVVDGYFEIDQKTAINITRSVSPQKVVFKKQLHPVCWNLEIVSFASIDLLYRYFFLAKYNDIELSNYVSSGAKIYQEIASI